MSLIKLDTLMEANLTLAAHEAKTDKAQIITKAVATYLYIKKQIKEGNKVILKDKHGNTKEVTIP